MVSVLAIDPGNMQSACVMYTGRLQAVLGEPMLLPNEELLCFMSSMKLQGVSLCAVEMVASYGMPVGATVFETCLWAGRFVQVLAGRCPVMLVYRRDVKLHLCGSCRAKDGNVRQALIDKLGPPGTKAKPGPTYGLRADMWAALGVAVTVAEIGQSLRAQGRVVY